MRLKLVIALVVGCVCASPSHAVLTAYEDFAYTNNQTVVGKNGGTGFSASWTNTNSPSQSAGTIVRNVSQPNAAYIQTSGLYLGVSGTDDPQIYRNLSSTYGGAGTNLWISYLLRKDSNGLATDYAVLNLGNAMIGAGSTGKYEIADTNLSAAAVGSNTRPLGETVLVMASINFTDGNDLVSLFISPTESGGFSLTPTATKSFEVGSGINSVGFLFGFTAGWSVDELRMGTTLADVAPIPEPGSLSIVMLGSVGLLRRRRRA